MQTFPTSVHSVSNSATPKAELHICLHSRAWRGCAGSAGSAGNRAATNHLVWQPGSTKCHWHETGTHRARKKKKHCWWSLGQFMHVSGSCGKKGKRKKEKNNKHTNETGTKIKQNTSFGPSLTTMWDPLCMLPLARKQRKVGEIYLQRARRQVQNKNIQHKRPLGKRNRKQPFLFFPPERHSDEKLYTTI